MKNIILKRILLAGLVTCVIAGNSANCFAETEEEESQTSIEEVTENSDETFVDESLVGLFSDSTPDLSVQSDAAAPEYRLVGMQDGDIIVMNESLGKNVSVIAENTETFTVKNGKEAHNGYQNGTVFPNAPDAAVGAAAKVIYYVDSTVFATDTQAPFVQTVPAETLGIHTLKAEVYDSSDALLETITRSYEVVYGDVCEHWSEDFEGTNPVIPPNMVNSPDTSKTMTYTEIWKQEIKTYDDSEALYVNSGHTVRYDGQNTAYISIGLFPDGMDFTNNLNRVYLEFDYMPGYYGAQVPNLALSEKYKLGNGAGDYAQILLPTALLRPAANNQYKKTRIGVEVSYDSKDTGSTVSYKLYLNGLEYYRNTTYSAHRGGGINPQKLNAILMNSNALKWDWYIDNIRVTAYNEVSLDGVVLGDPTVTLYGDDDAAMSGMTGIDTGLNYFTVDVPGGTDITTLSGNVTLKDDITGENIELSVENEKIRVLEQLVAGSSYTISVGNKVKNLEGKSMLGDKNLTVTTKTGTLCVDRSATGFAESELPAAGGTVTFNAKLKGSNVAGKKVTVVCAVYNGSKMADATVIAQRTSDSLGNLPAVTVTLTEVTDNTVVEAFVVNNTTDLSPISYEVYSLN